MKKYMKQMRYVGLMVVAALCMACDEAIVTGTIDADDEQPFVTALALQGFLRDAGTARTAIPVEVRADTEVQVYLGLTKATGDAATARVAVDAARVDAYNTANNTEYPAFPAAQVSISNNGSLSVAKWQTSSDPLAVTLAKGTLEEATYLLPLAVTSSDVTIPETEKVLYYFVKVAGATPSTAKPGGVVSICYVEVGSNNPLNVGAYTLKNSGIPFFDICIIFAANLNYDVAASRPYIHFNESVAHLLKNRDKYIKPLQDKGIKVLLDILPNHYGIGWNNLNAAAAKDLAYQLRAIVDAYGLDGIDFDEEWADYGTNGLPGENTTSYRRMVYEMRQAMPDKLITMYYIGTNNSFATQIEGINPGDLVDYAYWAYYNPTDVQDVPATGFLGMTRAKWGPYPYAFHGTNGITAYPPISTANVTSLKDGGYGVNLMYDLRGKSNTHPDDEYMDYSDRLTIFSNILYGEETVAGEIYQKDW
jgi:hypothetical protein